MRHMHLNQKGEEEGAEEEQLLGGLLLCWVSVIDV